MDPANGIGLAISILQILKTAYKIGKEAKSAKEDIRRLAQEVSTLKASLEYIKFISESEDDNPILMTSSLASPEFQEMLLSTEKVLTELLQKLQPKTGKLKNTWQRLTWHFEKSEIREYLDRLDRAKSWFVLAASTDNTAVCRVSYAKICNIEQSLQRQEERYANEEVKDKQERLRTWLNPDNPQALYQQALQNFRAGTGVWFLEGQFRNWMHGNDNRGLWLKAKPGFGKTTLMSGAISAAKSLFADSGADRAIAYWFCSFTEQSSRDLHHLLVSVIYQLAWSNPDVSVELDRKYTEIQKKGGSGSQERLNLNDLRDLLRQVVSQIGPVHLFIDAVNEHAQPEMLMEVLDGMLEDFKNCRIFITSTESLLFQDSRKLFTIVRAAADTNARDIDFYVDASIQENTRLKNLRDSVKYEIRNRLSEKAHGSFRWVQCQMETLCSQKTLGDIIKALHSLPSTLEQTYQRALDRIPHSDRIRARNTILWLCFAYRKMWLVEIAEAAVLPINEEYDPDSMRLLISEEILDLCSSLVSYDERQRTVSLAHSSVLDFFIRATPGNTNGEFRMYWDDEQDTTVLLDPDTFIAQQCLTYLLMPEFASGYVEQAKVRERFDQWPLLRYISIALWNHLADTDPEGPIKPLLTRFFNSQRLSRGGNFGAWVQSYSPLLRGESIEQTTPLFWASRVGNVPLVRALLSTDGNRDLERPGGRVGSTPLHIAAWAGEPEVVKLLLAAGANVHEKNDLGDSGLSWAIVGHYEQHKEIVRLLEDAGAGAELEPGIREF